MNVTKEINGLPIIGEIKVEGIRYYIDVNKNVYAKENGTYIKVTDEKTLWEIVESISTESIDVR